MLIPARRPNATRSALCAASKPPLRSLADMCMHSPHLDTSSASDSRRYGSSYHSSHLAPKPVNRAKDVPHTYEAHSRSRPCTLYPMRTSCTSTKCAWFPHWAWPAAALGCRSKQTGGVLGLGLGGTRKRQILELAVTKATANIAPGHDLPLATITHAPLRIYSMCVWGDGGRGQSGSRYRERLREGFFRTAFSLPVVDTSHHPAGQVKPPFRIYCTASECAITYRSGVSFCARGGADLKPIE
jgi:hypothetical protein